MSKLHLILPMAGRGSRFFENGFVCPKPLIEINGKPFFYWAARSIEKYVDCADITFVVLQEHIRDFAIDEKIRTYWPEARIIAVAKGAGILLKTYRQETGADAIGLDWSVPLSFAAELQKDGPVQGNLDPMRVVAGGASLDEGIDRILDVLGQGPLIFNLGHGITPQADPEHVTQLLARVRRP